MHRIDRQAPIHRNNRRAPRPGVAPVVVCDDCDMREVPWGLSTFIVTSMVSGCTVNRIPSCAPRVPRCPVLVLAGTGCPGARSWARAKGLMCPRCPLLDRGPERSGRIRACGSFWCTGAPPILPQARILPGNRESGPAPVPLAPPATTAPGSVGRPGAPGPERGDQTGTVASIVNRQAERPSAQLV
jgi:hypothetical protein